MPPFELCFNTSTIRPAAPFDKIKAAGAAGYSAIELWSDDLTAYERVGGSLADFQRALDGEGLRVADMVHIPGWMDASPADLPNVLDEARRRMAQGAALGAERIIAGPARGPVDLDVAAERFRALTAIGQEEGCLPALEFLGFVEHVNNVDVLMDIVRRADVPKATVVLDAFHIFRGGGEDRDILKVPGDRVAIFHIDDVPETDRPRETLTDGDRVYPGDGVLDLVGQLTMLKQQGFSGPVSLELFNAALWLEDPFEVARTGAEKVRALLSRVPA